MAREFRIAERDDVAGADLIKLLGGGVGEVRVDGGAIGAGADGLEDNGGERVEEGEDESVGGAVAEGGVVFGGGGGGDVGAELVGGGFELVLSWGGGGRSWRCSRTALLGLRGSKLAVMMVCE